MNSFNRHSKIIFVQKKAHLLREASLSVGESVGMIQGSRDDACLPQKTTNKGVKEKICFRQTVGYGPNIHKSFLDKNVIQSIW